MVHVTSFPRIPICARLFHTHTHTVNTKTPIKYKKLNTIHYHHTQVSKDFAGFANSKIFFFDKFVSDKSKQQTNKMDNNDKIFKFDCTDETVTSIVLRVHRVLPRPQLLPQLRMTYLMMQKSDHPPISKEEAFENWVRTMMAVVDGEAAMVFW